jgi:hypothetical protein
VAGASKLLCLRGGLEDRSDMQSADCIARSGLRALPAGRLATEWPTTREDL